MFLPGMATNNKTITESAGDGHWWCCRVSQWLAASFLSLFMSVAHAEPLLVFVSFSMPSASLYRLAKESVRIDAQLILRGLPGERKEDVLANLHRLSTQAPDVSLLIDPTLFEDFSIQQVPVFIWPLTPCVKKTETRNLSCSEGPYLRLAGDVDLEYVLEKMSEHEKDRSDIRQSLLQLRNHR